jgi:hypothetical protein
MSDLLNQASLVMVPSGYKEDTVYSVVPSDGSGDLSFTRASNGTRINSAGLVEVCPWNLLEQSETFDNGVWVKTSGVTISSNSVVAPNGTTTADVITFNGSNRDIQQVIAVTNGVFSFYAKGSGTIFVGIASATQSQTEFTLTADWSRIEVPFTGTSSSVFIGNYGTTATSVTLWGAQVNIGSTAKPYFPTTDRLNVPRLTYQNGGGGCPSLLLEKQSTNLVTYSEQFDNGAWGKVSATITANTTISPDGTQDADTFTTTGGGARIFQTLSLGVGSYTTSIYVKKLSGSGNMRFFGIVDGSGVSQSFTPTDNWQRFTGNFTASTGITEMQLREDGFSGSLAIWGFQLEASSYPTSYIPTTSSSATRVADACYKTGISSLIGQTEGVIFWEGKISDVTGGELCDLNANGDKFIQIYNTLVGSTPTIGLYIQNVSVLLNNSNIATIAYNSNFKFALAYKNNDYVAYLNGVQVYVNTTIGVPATSNFSIGAYNQGNVTANKNTNQVALFKTRLTNAELASLTTI